MAYNYDPFDPYQLRQQSMMGNIGMGNVGADMTGGVNPFQTLPTNPNVPDMSAAYNAPQQPPQQPQPQQPNGMQQRIDLMNQFFPVQTQANDRFNTMIAQQPEMNTPSTARKLVAGLGSMGQYNKQTGMFSGGGPEQAEKIMYEPYLRETARWKEGLTPAQQAATLENTSNNINRQAGSTMVNAEVAAEKAAQAAKDAADKDEATRIRQEEVTRHNKANEQTAALRAGVLDYKAKNPNSVFKTGTDGYVYKLNPAAGNNDQPVNTGLKASDLSDWDKFTMGLEHQDKIEAAREQTQMDIHTTPSGKAEAPTTGKQFTAEQQIAAKTMWESSDPAIRQIARKWLTQGDDKMFNLNDMPVVGEGKSFGLFGEGYTQADVDEWKKVHDAFYPTKPTNSGGTNTPYVPPIQRGKQQSNPQSGGIIQQPAPTGSGGSLKMPQLPPSFGGKLGSGLYKIGQPQAAPNIPDTVSPNAPKVGDRVGVGQDYGSQDSSNYVYEKNDSNPMLRRRTDQQTGQVEYSNDGGISWKAGK